MQSLRCSDCDQDHTLPASCSGEEEKWAREQLMTAPPTPLHVRHDDPLARGRSEKIQQGLGRIIERVIGPNCLRTTPPDAECGWCRCRNACHRLGNTCRIPSRFAPDVWGEAEVSACFVLHGTSFIPARASLQTFGSQGVRRTACDVRRPASQPCTASNTG